MYGNSESQIVSTKNKLLSTHYQAILKHDISHILARMTRSAVKRKKGSTCLNIGYLLIFDIYIICSMAVVYVYVQLFKTNFYTHPFIYQMYYFNKKIPEFIMK